jgi:hypothetical protein
MDPGLKFELVPDVCVVYITKFDIFEGDLPLYHVDRVVRETHKTVDNGFAEVYVNAKVKDGSEVSELMEVFVKDQVYNPKFPKTSQAKRRYKETERGIDTMCDIMEKIAAEEREEGRAEGREEGRKEGKVEGIAEGKIQTLFNLVKDGILTFTQAAERAGMTEGLFLEAVKKLEIE